MENALRAQDLRIGNLVIINQNTEFEKVHEVIWHDLGLDKTPFAPIPLTEQWLLRGGFVKKENKYESTSLCLIRNGLSKTDWFNVYSHISGDFYSKYPITTVTYVHQLQNLHFALTGQELEFKD